MVTAVAPVFFARFANFAEFITFIIFAATDWLGWRYALPPSGVLFILGMCG